MPLQDNFMGKAGHALEVDIAALFKYNGFVVRTNVKTSAGEMDVVLDGEYSAAIECKEYNAKSAATVTRDMISNIAKKCELLGLKNAVLVVTKAPSLELQEYARQAGVILRIYINIKMIQDEVAKLDSKEQKMKYLISEFNLKASETDSVIQKRREFVKMFLGGKITKIGIVNSLFDYMGQYKKQLVIGGSIVLILLILALWLFPSFRQGVFVWGIFIIIIVISFQNKSFRRKFGLT